MSKLEKKKLFPTNKEGMLSHLGDNCIVFENFTASVGDLMVAN